MDEDVEPLDTQRATLVFSKVCLAWYSAAEFGRELAVQNVKRAQRLVRCLKVEGTGGQKPRSLWIYVDDVPQRGAVLAGLLESCPQLEVIELTLKCTLGGTTKGPENLLGVPTTRALLKLSHVRDFKVTYETRYGNHPGAMGANRLAE